MSKDVVLMIYPGIASAATVDIFLSDKRLNVVGIVVSNRFNKNSNVFKDAKRILTGSGLKFMNYCLMMADLPWLLMGLESRFKRQTKNIPVLWTKDVNSDESKSWIRDRRCDYIASCYFNQIIDMEVAAIPSKDCVNVHAAMLPERRGPLPIFWSMYQGVKNVGISVHKVEEELDMGEVYYQEQIPLKDESLIWNEFYYWSHAARILSQWIADPDAYKFGHFVQNPNEGSYQGFPKKDDVNKFLEKGNVLFRRADLKRAVGFVKAGNYQYLASEGIGHE